MSTQTEAARLADSIEHIYELIPDDWSPLFWAARELRRLESENKQLKLGKPRLQPLSEAEIDNMLGDANRGFCIEWELIETAPKTGRTLLLGYFNSHGNWRTMRGQWMSKDYIDEYWEDPEGAEAGWYETCVNLDLPPNCWYIDPTHWVPLPKPPAPKKDTK